MTTIITTRSRDFELYQKACRFWPETITHHRVTGKDGYENAAHYLWHILQFDHYTNVINCDEDCFVFDWSVVAQLLADMESEGATHAGMPDTKEHCHHRNNAPFVHNPFFTVYRPSRIRPLLTTEPDVHVTPPGCTACEPFNNLYHHLHHIGKAIDLRGLDHPDGISTTLSYRGKPFALHSWYSRDYHAGHRARIDALLNSALDLFKSSI